jgi:hypothetical protein
MPKLKQPMPLQDVAMRRVVKMIHKACESWITTLREAARTGSEAYLKETQNVTAECDSVREFLTSLLTGISAHQANLIMTEIIPLITNYDDGSNELKRASWYQDEIHNNLCLKMLRAVLPAGIEEFFINCGSSGFAQKLVIHTLDTTPNLTSLCFQTKTKINNSALLASNIHHLRNLQSFSYFYHCTAEVVEQLGLHCTQLRTINLKYSRAVTDTCVQHLLKLNKLEYVHLMYTAVSCALYGSLLSELPSIRNIVMMSAKCDVLDHISKETLCTIKKYAGLIHDIDNVTQKCPNIKTAVVYALNQDLTNLIALTRLVDLQIMVGSYEKCNLTGLLIGMGCRLSDLTLFRIRKVNFANIVLLCSPLKRLVLEECTFVQLTENADIDTDPPHYRNVTEFKLIGKSRHKIDVRHLLYYINLQIFECKGVNILTDDFIHDAMRQGAFRNILRFWVEETGHGALTMRTVELLLQHCDNLREIGLVESWRRVTQNECSDLIERMRIMNIDLHVHYSLVNNN